MQANQLTDKELADLRHEILREMEEERSRPIPGVPKRALVWMALTPLWTPALAAQCEFPTETPSGHDSSARIEAVRKVLARLYEERLCEVQPVYPPFDADQEAQERAADLTEYWLQDATRASILKQELADAGGGLSSLQMELVQIGTNIVAAVANQAPVVPRVARWAELAAAAQSTGACAEVLIDKVNSCLSTTPPQLGSAQAWIDAAIPIAQLLGGELRDGVVRGRRQMELADRSLHDERYLARFIKRQKDISAFRRLLKDSGKGWALHYIGPGGAGKTMLMRYLAYSYRTDPELALPIATIDFDFINPDYPSRDPALLLDMLSQELRLYSTATTSASSAFGRFDSELFRLRESTRPSTGRHIIYNSVLDVPGFRSLLVSFAEAIKSLPRSGPKSESEAELQPEMQPVVLMLDTCEELAKVRPEGDIPVNIKATFEILEELHELMPQIRVVFCGRRPLARSGYGDWSCDTSDLPGRPYLRLYEVRAFNRDQAESYLQEKEELTQDKAKAILEITTDLTYLPCLSKTRPKDRRYSPFDLALYAALVRTYPDITADILRNAGVSHYVQLRVVSGLTADMREQVLPAVAILGRFDRPTLSAAIGAAIGDDLWREVASQEWIDGQQSNFLAVDAILLPRLRAYYRSVHSGDLIPPARRLADYLVELSTTEPFDKLALSHFDGAFRALQIKGDFEEATTWWQKIEERLANEQAYDWAHRLTNYLLSEDGPLALPDPSRGPNAEPESPLRVLALATSASVSLARGGPATDLANTWLEVEHKAHKCPPATLRLQRRALLGQITARCYQGLPVEQDSVLALWAAIRNLKLDHSLTRPPGEDDDLEEPTSSPAVQRLDVQLCAAHVAAVEAVVESFEIDSTQVEEVPFEALIRLANELRARQDTVELGAFLNALTGRLLALHGRPTEAVNQFNLALQAKFLQSGTSSSRWWLDWRAPDDLAARLRLEYIRVAYPTVLPPGAVLSRLGDEISAPRTIDANRLGTAVLTLRGALRPHSLEELDRLDKEIGNVGDFDEQCQAHFAFAPLSLAVGEALADAGKVDRGLESLRAETRALEGAALGLDYVHSADRAVGRIVRRWRLRDERVGIESTLEGSPEAWDQVLVSAIYSLSGVRSTVLNVDEDQERTVFSTASSWDLHLQWRAYYPEPPGARQRVLWETYWPRLTYLDIGDSSTFEDVSYYLDAVEATLLAHYSGEAPGGVQPVVVWTRSGDKDPVAVLTALLRAYALSDEGMLEISPDLVDRVGVRRAALIALEEGELLALRLPQNALRLLRWAGKQFRDVEDLVNGVITGICESLVLAKSFASLRSINERDTSEFREVMEEVSRLYEALTTRGLALPMAEELARIASELSMGRHRSDLDALKPEGWRPWLVRFIGCMILASDQHHSGSDWMQELLAWVRDNYGSTVGASLVLPPEFDYLNEASKYWHLPPEVVTGVTSTVVATEERPTLVSAGDRESKPERADSAFLNWLSEWWLIFPGLLIVVTLLASGYWAFQAVVHIFHPPEVPFEIMVLGYVAFFVTICLVIYSLPQLLDTVQAELAARSEIDLAISPLITDPQTTSNSGSLIVLSLRTRTPTFRLFRWPPQPWPFHWPPYVMPKKSDLAEETRSLTDSNLPYAYVAPVMLEPPEPPLNPPMIASGRVMTELEALRDRLLGRRASMQLTVDRTVYGISWEGVVGLPLSWSASAASRTKGNVPFRFHRILPGANTRPGEWQQNTRALSVVRDLNQEGLAQDGWKALKLQDALKYRVISFEDLLLGKGAYAKPLLLHVIANPLATSTGVRLQVSNASLSTNRKSRDNVRGELMRAEELVRVVPGATLVILQASTQETALDERTSANREVAANLRIFAGELFLLGIPAVLTIPNLPADLAVTVLERLATAVIVARKEGFGALLVAVDDCRSAVLDYRKGATDALLETAFDFCLYGTTDDHISAGRTSAPR